MDDDVKIYRSRKKYEIFGKYSFRIVLESERFEKRDQGDGEDAPGNEVAERSQYECRACSNQNIGPVDVPVNPRWRLTKKLLLHTKTGP